jgi:hypothetical protein
MHEVMHACSETQRGHVGDKPPVTAPPHALAAHHCGSLLTCLVEKFGHCVKKWCRPSVGRVRAELLDLPPGVLCHIVSG